LGTQNLSEGSKTTRRKDSSRLLNLISTEADFLVASSYFSCGGGGVDKNSDGPQINLLAGSGDRINSRRADNPKVFLVRSNSLADDGDFPSNQFVLLSLSVDVLPDSCTI